MKDQARFGNRNDSNLRGILWEHRRLIFLRILKLGFEPYFECSNYDNSLRSQFQNRSYTLSLCQLQDIRRSIRVLHRLALLV